MSLHSNPYSTQNYPCEQRSGLKPLKRLCHHNLKYKN
jgi:hypothetical protein